MKLTHACLSFCLIVSLSSAFATPLSEKELKQMERETKVSLVAAEGQIKEQEKLLSSSKKTLYAQLATVFLSGALAAGTEGVATAGLITSLGFDVGIGTIISNIAVSGFVGASLTTAAGIVDSGLDIVNVQHGKNLEVAKEVVVLGCDEQIDNDDRETVKMKLLILDRRKELFLKVLEISETKQDDLNDSHPLKYSAAKDKRFVEIQVLKAYGLKKFYERKLQLIEAYKQAN